ncbi:MAG TPA: divalent metal cation transporter [Thermomicrobiales bacterium]|nr:divalent metal cation transporter [Thermomicrobiales bacterium]
MSVRRTLRAPSRSTRSAPKRRWPGSRLVHSVDFQLIRASREARKGVHGLGPGLITGVADDDPSGISTYTVTGATWGYQFLWTSVITLPMNIAVQSVCARVGLVTGRGLAGTIRSEYGRRWLYPIVALLFVANTINIGADIVAIAAVIDMLTGLPATVLVLPIGLGIALLEIIIPYPRFARYLKLLTLVIFAYVIGAFFASPDWGAAAAATVIPKVSLTPDAIQTFVAILGTTISPYLFFWQVSEEVEEEESRGITPAAAPPGQMRSLLHAARLDVATGMVLANVGFYFIVLTSAATLHAAHQNDIQTAAQAAEALRPLAGSASSLLFALGIIGTGLLAIPTLAGSSAYAASELFDWPEGLNKTFRRAPQFYIVIALATLLGGLMTFTGISEISALILAATVNGVIAPILLVFIMSIAGNRHVLGEYVFGRTTRIVGWATTVSMALAAILLFATLRS